MMLLQDVTFALLFDWFSSFGCFIADHVLLWDGSGEMKWLAWKKLHQKLQLTTLASILLVFAFGFRHLWVFTTVQGGCVFSTFFLTLKEVTSVWIFYKWAWSCFIKILVQKIGRSFSLWMMEKNRKSKYGCDPKGSFLYLAWNWTKFCMWIKDKVCGACLK